jgi:hypothetical protein
MGYGFQPAEIIPLSYISYQAVFPTPAPCHSRQWPGLNGRIGFPVFVRGSIPIATDSIGNDSFSSHGRGRRFNPYSVHHHKQLSAFAESIGLILLMIGPPMIAPKKSMLVIYGTLARCVGA